VKITNRKQRRKAQELGVLHEVTNLTNKITGNEAQLIVTWSADFTPTLVVIEDEKVVYEAPAIELITHVASLTTDAIARFRESLDQK
jgi:hypothetical protein